MIILEILRMLALKLSIITYLLKKFLNPAIEWILILKTAWEAQNLNPGSQVFILHPNFINSAMLCSHDLFYNIRSYKKLYQPFTRTAVPQMKGRPTRVYPVNKYVVITMILKIFVI